MKFRSFYQLYRKASTLEYRIIAAKTKEDRERLRLELEALLDTDVYLELPPSRWGKIRKWWHERNLNKHLRKGGKRRLTSRRGERVLDGRSQTGP